MNGKSYGKEATVSDSDSLQQAQPETYLEREFISNALLNATEQLAKGQDPAGILRRTCNALIAASPHIKLAWMSVGTATDTSVAPEYATGAARGFAQHLVKYPLRLSEQDPLRHAVFARQLLARTAGEDFANHPAADSAQVHKLDTVLYLPFTRFSGAAFALVVLYVDQGEFLERIGLEPFSAFARMVQVLLEQSVLRQKLQHVAALDHLTGLVNRGAMVEILEREHARAERNRNAYSLLLFDLDHFKMVNDSYGHAVGDEVLAGVAGVAQQTLRDGDWLGRWGGEEFLAVLPATEHEVACQVAERLRDAISARPLHTSQWSIASTVTVGVASYPADAQSVDEVLRTADANLYEAKRSGRNRVKAGLSTGNRIVSLAAQLQTALRDQRLRVAYQPIVNVHSHEVVGEEALARIESVDGHLLTAANFVDAASQLGIIHQIDVQVIRSCLTRWHHRQTAKGGKRFINVSADLLRHPELVRDILEQADSGHNDRGDLVMVIAEREFGGDPARILDVLSPFLDFGVQLAIDDFGCGHASFRFLAELPVSYLKYEGSLIRRLVQDRKVRAIVAGVQATAQELGIQTVAECVEEREVAERLADLGVPLAQGYLYGTPAVA